MLPDLLPHYNFDPEILGVGIAPSYKHIPGPSRKNTVGEYTHTTAHVSLSNPGTPPLRPFVRAY